MNTRLRSASYITVIALVLGFSSLAWAESCDRGPARRWFKGKGEGGFTLKKLNLSPEQEQKIIEQKKQLQEQSKELRAKMADVRSQLKQELEVPKPDKSKVYALVAQMKELMGKGLEQRVERIFMLKEILTPEQIELMNQKRGDFKHKKEERREKVNHRGAYHRDFGGRGEYARFCQ